MTQHSAPLRMFVFTNDSALAARATAAGASRIVVDLEIMGKHERQMGRDTVISRHAPEDITRLRAVVPPGQLVVRVNPLWDGSRDEVEDAIARGADHVMLPMWTTAEEVARFTALLRGRAAPIPLLETIAAAAAAPAVVDLAGVHEMHIGLTDLHLQHRMRFLFEVLSEGLLDPIAAVCRSAGVHFGFGGVGRVGQDLLPPEWVLAEHERMGSTGVILSRSFLADPAVDFPLEVRRIRDCFDSSGARSDVEREADRRRTQEHIRGIARSRPDPSARVSGTRAPHG